MCTLFGPFLAVGAPLPQGGGERGGGEHQAFVHPRWGGVPEVPSRMALVPVEPPSPPRSAPNTQNDPLKNRFCPPQPVGIYESHRPHGNLSLPHYLRKWLQGVSRISEPPRNQQSQDRAFPCLPPLPKYLGGGQGHGIRRFPRTFPEGNFPQPPGSDPSGRLICCVPFF